MNAIIPAKRSTEIAQTSVGFLRAADSMLSALERKNLQFVIPEDRAPTDEQRAYMRRRSDEISEYLAPAAEPELIGEVTLLLTALQPRSGDAADQKTRLKLYVVDLAGAPLNAIRRACAAYRRGELGDGKWAPSPGELRQAAFRSTQSLATERANFTKILEATVVPARESPGERRKQVTAEALQKFHSALAEKTAAAFGKPPRSNPYAFERPAPVVSQAEAQAALDKLLSNPTPLPTLSESARRALNMPIPDEPEAR